MHIQIIGVSKLKEKYLVQWIAEYSKSLPLYVKFQTIEANDEKAPDTLSETKIYSKFL